MGRLESARVPILKSHAMASVKIRRNALAIQRIPVSQAMPVWQSLIASPDSVNPSAIRSNVPPDKFAWMATASAPTDKLCVTARAGPRKNAPAVRPSRVLRAILAKARWTVSPDIASEQELRRSAGPEKLVWMESADAQAIRFSVRGLTVVRNLKRVLAIRTFLANKETFVSARFNA